MTGQESEAAGISSRGKGLWSLRLFAAALLCFSTWVLYSSFNIPSGGGYVAVGPKVFPMAIGTGLVVMSVLFLIQTTLRPDRYLIEKAGEEAEATHWWTLALLLGLLIGYVLLLERLGFALSSAIFFPVACRLFGSRRPIRDLAVGLALSFAVYYLFDGVLGVRLPDGVLPF